MDVEIHYEAFVVGDGAVSDDGRSIDEVSAEGVVALVREWSCDALVEPLRQRGIDGTALCLVDSVKDVSELAPEASLEVCQRFMQGVIELRKNGISPAMVHKQPPKCFDSSYVRGVPFAFRLGNGDVIDGLDAEVAAMAVGERREFTVEPSRAYGTHGLSPRVPPNATLRFVVELVSAASPQSASDATRPVDECERCAAEAAECKAAGNARFKAKAFDEASVEYLKALSLIQLGWPDDALRGPASDEVEGATAARRTALGCYLNLAACCLQTQAFRKAAAHCTAALAVDARSVKGLYRRAQAHVALGGVVDARADLRAAIAIDPSNAAVRALYAKTQKKGSASQSQRSLFAGKV